MRRKDCDDFSLFAKPQGLIHRIWQPMLRSALGLLMLGVFSSPSLAASLHMWPSSVVVDDTIHLTDLCELRGFAPALESQLKDAVIANAPTPGGSRVIHLDMVRSALAASGTNLATVTLGGARECLVTRPTNAALKPTSPTSRGLSNGNQHPQTPPVSLSPNGTNAPAAAESTLRGSVLEYLNREFARYGGQADVAFNRASAQILNLSGPEYTFKVRHGGGRLLGLAQLEVDVLSGDYTVQTVPVVAQVSMVRPVVVARRAINQNATIRASDVELQSISFVRFDRLGVDNTSLVIGQRAKRFVSAGTQIELAMLEPIPLVTRGQLVTLTSVAGGVSVVTTAKALHDALYGETVTLRSTDRKRTEFEGAVVGPGSVRIGASTESQMKLAIGDAS